MTPDWGLLRAAHVTAACERLADRQGLVPRGARGLVVRYQDGLLPAKHVLREAYRLAAELPADREIRFTSGEGTLKLLQSLGFDAFRLGPA